MVYILRVFKLNFIGDHRVQAGFKNSSLDRI